MAGGTVVRAGADRAGRVLPAPARPASSPRTSPSARHPHRPGRPAPDPGADHALRRGRAGGPLRPAGAGDRAVASRIALPARGRTSVQIEAGAAGVNVQMPDGVAARIRFRGGMASKNIDEGRFPRVGDEFRSSGYDVAEDRADIGIQGGLARSPSADGNDRSLYATRFLVYIIGGRNCRPNNVWTPAHSSGRR